MIQDMTVGSPTKLIIRFAIPLFFGNLCQQLYSVADTLIVGRTIGINALAAVGSTGSISFLIIGFAQGLAAGLAIVTAQRFGAQNEKGVRQSVCTSAILSVIVTVVCTMFSTLFAKQILVAMNTPPAIFDDAYQFIIIIFTGFGAAMLFNLLSNLILALGNSRVPLLFLLAASALNVALELLFILGLHMGVAGAALATVLAQLCSCAGCLVYIAKRFPVLHPKASDWKLTRDEFTAHLHSGLPMAFQNSIIAIGIIIIQFSLNGLGENAVAAYAAAQKLDLVCTQPMIAFGMTMATFSAQNFGAGHYDRIRVGVHRGILLSVSVSMVLALMVILFGRYAVGLFVLDAPKVVELAQIYFYTNQTFYFLLCLLLIIRYTLQGLGKSFVPTAAGIMELIMRAVAAFVFARHLGFAGVSLCNALAWLGSLTMLVPAYLMISRTWKTVRAPEHS